MLSRTTSSGAKITLLSGLLCSRICFRSSRTASLLISRTCWRIVVSGKGLNQSIALSKAGADVWHAGAVGAGDGDFLIEQMKKAGVHTELIEHLDGQTGHAIIQKDPAGQNCILLYGGANQRITRKMVDRVLTQF